MRELEVGQLLSQDQGCGVCTHKDPSADDLEGLKPSARDFQMLANAIIFLINKEESEKVHENEIQACQELDQVYRLVILQLIKKIGQLQGDSQESPIDQFVPTGEKNQRLWYLQLLESQVKSADQTASRLYEFVSRLQVEIQGCLTSEAQIKAINMNLAQSASETLQEINLLKSVATLIRSDIEQLAPRQSPMATNPFVEPTGDEQVDALLQINSSIDLKSLLKITNKVKKSLEKDLVSLKKTLYDTKNQYREEQEALTSQNQQLEKALQKIEREMPRLKSENGRLVRQVADLEKANRELTSLASQEHSVNEMEAKVLRPMNKKMKETIKQIEEERQRDNQVWQAERNSLTLKLKEIE